MDFHLCVQQLRIPSSFTHIFSYGMGRGSQVSWAAIKKGATGLCETHCLVSSMHPDSGASPSSPQWPGLGPWVRIWPNSRIPAPLPLAGPPPPPLPPLPPFWLPPSLLPSPTITQPGALIGASAHTDAAHPRLVQTCLTVWWRTPELRHTRRTSPRVLSGCALSWQRSTASIVSITSAVSSVV